MSLKKLLGLSPGKRTRRNPSGTQWLLIGGLGAAALYGVSQLAQPAPASTPATSSGGSTPPAGGNNAAAGGSQTIQVPTNVADLMDAAFRENGSPGAGLNAGNRDAWIAAMQSVLPLSYNQWSNVWDQVSAYVAKTGTYPSKSLTYAMVLKATKIAS